LPDGTERAVQVGLFVAVEPLGIKVPGRQSIMLIPMTDSLAGTIAENEPKVHRPGSRFVEIPRLIPAAPVRCLSSF
jgi:hypothetical protein